MPLIQALGGFFKLCFDFDPETRPAYLAPVPA